MPSVANIALARGLAVLCSSHGIGESYRVVGTATPFVAVVNSRPVKDVLGGECVETVMLVARSAFTTLPPEGTVIEADDTGEKYAVASYRPAPASFVNIIVRSEVQ